MTPQYHHEGNGETTTKLYLTYFILFYFNNKAKFIFIKFHRFLATFLRFGNINLKKRQ